MIVRYPYVPPVLGGLKVSRPAVFMLGSYRGHLWQSAAARMLESHTGSIFYATPSEPLDGLVDWTFHWLNQMDGVLVWIDNDGPWHEFELGYVLGRMTIEVAVGVAPGLDALADSMATILAACHQGRLVHRDLSEAVSAIEVQSKRRERINHVRMP